MEYRSRGVEETEALGERLGARLSPGDVVACRGDLGAGKTAFTRGLVTSPTFTIVNEHQGRVPLFHFDWYRLGGEEELFDIGWEEYLARGGVCAVEWSERAPEALPEGTVTVTIRRDEEDEDQRQIAIEGVEEI